MRLHKGSISTAFLAVILAAVLFGCGKVQSGDTAAPDPSDIVSERDDFYEAVNGELLAQWEIEPDESVTNWFIRLTDQNTELITEIIGSVQPKQDSVFYGISETAMPGRRVFRRRG